VKCSVSTRLSGNEKSSCYWYKVVISLEIQDPHRVFSRTCHIDLHVEANVQDTSPALWTCGCVVVPSLGHDPPPLYQCERFQSQPVPVFHNTDTSYLPPPLTLVLSVIINTNRKMKKNQEEVWDPSSCSSSYTSYEDVPSSFRPRHPPKTENVVLEGQGPFGRAGSRVYTDLRNHKYQTRKERGTRKGEKENVVGRGVLCRKQDYITCVERDG
jgi:hypothetical protein